MSENETEKAELSEEELDGEEAEELPARETMMILDPGPMPLAGAADLDPIPAAGGETEAPDDRYEQ
jgi:hypothetical protein